MSAGDKITSVLVESRVFPPPPAFAAQARVGSLAAYEALCARAAAEPERFWAEIASELAWSQPWREVLD